MKRITIGVVSAGIIAMLCAGVLPVTAAKPQKAIEMSNGMPSGEHETLLIHGKKASFICEEPTEFGNVVNIPEYTVEGTDETIKYVSGRKVKVDHLTVFDTCTETFDGSPAEVWLPYEQEGYWVFMRALGKPGKGEEERYIIFENESLEAYPLLEDVSNPDEVILGLGMITQQGAFEKDASGKLYRFDGDGDKGKGKSQGRDMTDMFLWSGLVFHPDLDVNKDGSVNQLDVIAECCWPWDADQNGNIDPVEVNAWAADHGDPDDVTGDGNVDYKDVIADTCSYDADGDGEISYDGDFDPVTFPDCEFEKWLNDNKGDPENPLWAYYDEVWVFTIADLVYLNQVVTNVGIKNVQIRFYPKDTTTFTPFEQ